VPDAAARLRAAGPVLYGLAAGSDVGGEVYERELAERLGAHGVEQRLGLPRDHGLRPVPGGVTVDLPGHDTGLHWTAAPRVFVPYVVRLLRAGRADVLRGHSVRFCGPSLLLARRLAGARVPIVLHHHHFSVRWRCLEAAILRAADAVITVSEHSRRELLGAGIPAGRLHVALNGVAGPPPRPARPELWPDPAGLRLLYLGRLEDRKRPELAIESLAALRASGHPASLVLAGEGPARAALAGRAQAAGLDAQVRLLGRVSEAVKWELLDSAELLVFGSGLEGFGLVVAEAQSRGVPVLAAAGTATGEAMLDGRSGLLLAPSAAAFGAAACRLAAQPQRRAEMGREAVAFARRFDWDRTAGDVAAALRALTEA
jgi:glycosyltransferase involved in cell wall biosynthesis